MFFFKSEKNIKSFTRGLSSNAQSRIYKLLNQSPIDSYKCTLSVWTANSEWQQTDNTTNNHISKKSVWKSFHLSNHFTQWV